MFFFSPGHLLGESWHLLASNGEWLDVFVGFWKEQVVASQRYLTLGLSMFEYHIFFGLGQWNISQSPHLVFAHCWKVPLNSAATHALNGILWQAMTSLCLLFMVSIPPNHMEMHIETSTLPFIIIEVENHRVLIESLHYSVIFFHGPWFERNLDTGWFPRRHITTCHYVTILFTGLRL